MKRPAFMFYPGDWQRDTALRACSVGARGLWIELMCIMHQAEPYGHVILNGQAIDPARLARMVGATEREVTSFLGELEAAGVFSRNEAGQIFSRRMVRDEHIRAVRAAAGKLGGNPELLVRKVKQNPTTGDNQKPTPSYSVSSSENLSPSLRDEVSSAPPTTCPAVRIPDCPHEQIVELYHELLPTCPRVREWNQTRQGYLRTRWREKSKPNGSSQGYDSLEAGLAWWRKFFAYVAQSKFLTGGVGGRGDHPPFVADLEWLVRPNNFAKVIEGKYHTVERA